ncbi:MAG TPA: hypothetical protein VMD30_06030, partial [Tepidisphaeraceae bacterium]|nr:hypothetical protein [Tepidisphaeraceae bacterium]
AENCRDDFENNYNPGKTDTVMGLVSSGLHEIESSIGHARLLLPEARVGIATALRKDAVNDKNIDLRKIPDAEGELPDDLARWLAVAEVVVAVDDRFLMKVHTGGAMRVFYERGNSQEMDQQLDEQLALLKRALNIGGEDNSREEMAVWLERLSAGADRELEQHRVEGRRRHARLMRDSQKPPQSENPTFKIQLPNGKWMELPEH